MKHSIKIGKAYCRELGRSIDIVEAGINYFAQTRPRKKYLFYCSSPECEKRLSKVEILGINYHRVPIDSEGREAPELADQGREEDDPVMSPFFKTKPGFDHSDDCQWMIDQEAEQEYIAEADSPHEKKRRRQRVAAEGLIEETSFLSMTEATEIIETEQKQSDDNSADENKSSIRRRRRLDQAKERIARPKRSPYFSELVSNYMAVWEKRLFDEPLNVVGMGETTWGQFFFPIDWYTPENHAKHVFHGNVRITTLPYRFDWSKGLPNAVILHFYDEVTVGETKAKPSLMITRKTIEANPGAYVLMEAARSAIEDDQYKNYLRCYFYGRIDEQLKKKEVAEGETPELVLKVKSLRLDTLELRRVEIET